MNVPVRLVHAPRPAPGVSELPTIATEAPVPDFSFIIVSWNAQAYLRQCLDSIETESKGLDVEVIVVDNASSDGSPEMVKAEYPCVVLIENDANVGFARAN